MEDRRLLEEIKPGGILTWDSYTWDYSRTGHYSVKSGYWVLTHELSQDNHPPEILQPSLDALFQLIWKLEASPKIHHFLWKCLANCLTVAGNLAHRHLSREAYCARCNQSKESVNHLLFQCPYARLIWAISPIPAPQNGEMSESLYTNLHIVMHIKNQNDPEEKVVKLIPWLLWRI